MKKFIIPAAIAVAVLVVAGVVLWFTVLKPEEVIWQETGTYVNEKLGYGVSVPVGWTVREFPDTKDGAGFRDILDAAAKDEHKSRLAFDMFVYASENT